MEIIKANWNAPSCVQAFTTTTQGGVSKDPFQSNNFALHVGDSPTHVKHNRKLLKDAFLPSEPEWLEQTHSTVAVNVDITLNRNADASISHSKNQVLAILTADCLPIVITNTQGTEIAAIHAGWRGLLAGVIENTIQSMTTPSTALMAWIGPHICKNCFEVGADVLSSFTGHGACSPSMIQASSNDKWRINLAEIATNILQSKGLHSVNNCHYCTFEDTQRYFSYRRSGNTGRIATLIWLDR